MVFISNSNYNTLKSIFKELKATFYKDFHLGYYLGVLVFLGMMIFLNYYLNFESQYIEIYNQPNDWKRIFLYMLFYAFSFWGTVFIRKLCKLDCSFFVAPKFILLSFIGIFLLSFDAGFPYYHLLTEKYTSTPYYYYAHYIVANGYCVFTIFIPLFILHFFLKENDDYYGLRLEKKSFLVYVFMLLAMVPVVYFAASQPDFLRYYPKFQRTQIALSDPNRNLLIGGFEFFYSLDFISTELLFRGFFVVFLSRYAREHILIPIAVVYCFIHFGKPWAETLSSFFGGYILGLMAFQTKNIWGGIFVHVGIALLMEIFAFWFV